MASSSSSESYSREAESAGSAAPLMPPAGAGPSHLRPFASTSTSSRASSQMLSWVAPEDIEPFDPFAPSHNTNLSSSHSSSPHSNSQSPSHAPSAFPTTHDPLFDAPIPRPGASLSHSRNVSFTSLSGDRPPSALGLNPRDSSYALGAGGGGDRASTSLSLNYVPSKFSLAPAAGGVGPRAARRRRPFPLPLPLSPSHPNYNPLENMKQLDMMQDGEAKARARGGGVDAWKKGTNRMPDDRDDLHPPRERRGHFDRADMGGRWTRFKWVMFGFNVVYTVLALGALITILLIHLSILPHSAVIHTAHRTELLLSTLAASIALLTATLGWAGVMLNNRGMLAVYCLLLWVGFGVLVVPGYITYRRFALNLPAKLNAFWSQALDIDGRRAIQDALGCCGYPSPFVEASISARGPFLRFETKVLQRWYIAVFSLAGVNIGVIIASLLSANHVTYRFGKGMMPERYRLDEAAVRVVLENYAAQLAEEYGPEVAAAFVEHSEAQSRAASRAGSVMGDGLVTPASYSRFPTHQRSYSSFGTSGLPSPTHGHSRSYSSMGMGSPMARDRRESEADMGTMPMASSSAREEGGSAQTQRYGTIAGTQAEQL
ncbi:hypothetical protein DFH06DRAFT_1209190 [Mycena polygramma]|nr:hypothetical protein DFH06DRAFT_1209190 [Mycena polygramma]